MSSAVQRGKSIFEELLNRDESFRSLDRNLNQQNNAFAIVNSATVLASKQIDRNLKIFVDLESVGEEGAES